MATDIWFPVLLSLQVALASTGIVLPLAVALGWLLTRSRVPGKAIIDAVVSIPLVLPPVVTGYVLLIVFGRQSPLGAILEDMGVQVLWTWWAAVLASAIVSLPLAVRAIVPAMEAVDPDLEAMGRTLGYDERAVFWRVTLPLCVRGVLAGGVLAFARSLGEFGATIVAAGNFPERTQTIPLAIYMAIDLGQSGRVVTLAAIAALLSFGALWVTHRLTRPPGR